MNNTLKAAGRCQNCDWRGTGYSEEIPDYDQRVEQHETPPLGECPECRCLVTPLALAALADARGEE